MRVNYYFLFVVLSFSFVSTSQVGIGINNPDGSSILDISSTTKGMLTPRLDTSQRLGISTPAIGLLVYDTDLKSFYFFNGSNWQAITSADTTTYRRTGWVALNDNDSSFTLPYVPAADLTDYSNYTDILLDFENDSNDLILDSHAPTGVSGTDFFDSTNGVITPIAIGDAILLRLQFDANPDNANTAIVVAIDIGTSLSPIIIYEKTIPLLRSGGRINKISESILLYQLGTFSANGAKIRMAYTRANNSTNGTDCILNNFGLVINRM